MGRKKGVNDLEIKRVFVHIENDVRIEKEEKEFTTKELNKIFSESIDNYINCLGYVEKL